MVYYSVSGVWVGHHFQLWEGLLHPGRVPDGRRGSGNVQDSGGCIYRGGWHTPRGTAPQGWTAFLVNVGFSSYYSCEMCFLYLCSRRRQWSSTWANLPTEPRAAEDVSHFRTWSKRFITPQHFCLVTNNDSFGIMLCSYNNQRGYSDFPCFYLINCNCVCFYKCLLSLIFIHLRVFTTGDVTENSLYSSVSKYLYFFCNTCQARQI